MVPRVDQRIMTMAARFAKTLSALATLAWSTHLASGSGPIVITHGGAYSGRFESSDPRVPAVSIATTEPVVLMRSTITGPGDLIASKTDHVDVRITDVHACSARCTNRAPGRFVAIEKFDRVEIDNCDLSGTAGIYLLDYAGGTNGENGVVIQRNVATNIDGRYAEGRSGFSKKTDLVQFVQLDKVRGAPRVEIAWNQVVNRPGESCVEDVISIYLSSGTREKPISIHDNFIRGAYPGDPTATDYSGGGILIGDGVAPKAAGDPAFVHAYDNCVLDTVNYGIAAAAGHDLLFENNRILSIGELDDGTPIPAQNTGAYIWDSYHVGHDRFYNNVGRGNLIGWATAKGGRNDWWRPDAARWTDNRNWLGPLTRRLYDAEFTRWQARAKSASVAIGPRN